MLQVSYNNLLSPVLVHVATLSGKWMCDTIWWPDQGHVCYCCQDTWHKPCANQGLRNTRFVVIEHWASPPCLFDTEMCGFCKSATFQRIKISESQIGGLIRRMKPKTHVFRGRRRSSREGNRGNMLLFVSTEEGRTWLSSRTFS